MVQRIFLYRDATAPSYIVCFPTGFPHSEAYVIVFIMEIEMPYVVSPDIVKSFFTEQDRMPWSEFGEAGLFSELCFQKAHAPARQHAIRSLGHGARVTGTNARLAAQILKAGVQPIRVRKDFGVDAGDKRGVRERNRGIASGGDSLVLGKAKKRNPGRGLRPIGKRNGFGGAIVNDDDIANRICLINAGREGCGEKLPRRRKRG